jgi:hypothetical protein
VHVKKELRHQGVFTKMHEYLKSYMQEKGSCGIRVYYESKFEANWEPILKEMGIQKSHYAIYHIDTQTIQA